MTFAKAHKVTTGSVIIADAGFTCIEPNARLVVHCADDGLYVKCSSGRHYLDGHLDNGNLVGFYPAPAPAPA